MCRTKPTFATDALEIQGVTPIKVYRASPSNGPGPGGGGPGDRAFNRERLTSRAPHSEQEPRKKRELTDTEAPGVEPDTWTLNKQAGLGAI